MGTTNWAMPPAERSALYIPMHTAALTAGQGRYVTTTTTRVGHHLFGKQTILLRTLGTTSHDNVVGCSLSTLQRRLQVIRHPVTVDNQLLGIRKILVSCTALPRNKVWATTTAHFVLGTWYITKYICVFFDRRGVFAPASQGRSRRRSPRPTGNRPGTRRSRASPSPSPRGPCGALSKSKKSSQFRGTPLRHRGAEQAT